MVSTRVFTNCVSSCVCAGRMDTLTSIIERCKAMDQYKALCPSWNLCTFIADVALQADNSKLAFYALEFLAKWIVRGKNARPAVLLSVDGGLAVADLGTAARTYVPIFWTLHGQSYSALCARKGHHPLRHTLEKYMHMLLWETCSSTLNEFENAYGNSTEVEGDMFSPLISLYPLVLACSKNGFATLDSASFPIKLH